ETLAGSAPRERGHRVRVPHGACEDSRDRDAASAAHDGLEGPSHLGEAGPDERRAGEATLARHSPHEGRSPAWEEAPPDSRPPADGRRTPEDAPGRPRPGPPPLGLRRRTSPERARRT